MNISLVQVLVRILQQRLKKNKRFLENNKIILIDEGMDINIRPTLMTKHDLFLCLSVCLSPAKFNRGFVKNSPIWDFNFTCTVNKKEFPSNGYFHIVQ
jgi:hypothetical protein